MKFSEVVAQTLSWLERDGRVSYRALKREFEIDDEYLDDLMAEIIKAKRLAPLGHAVYSLLYYQCIRELFFFFTPQVAFRTLRSVG